MNTEKAAVSLKVMAEAKHDGVAKATIFNVAPEKLEVEEGYNARPIDQDHVESMAISYADGADFPTLKVSVDAGRIIVRDGHHRRAGALLAISRGAPIRALLCEQFRGDDADRVALLLTSSQGLPLTPLQRGVQYLKLVKFGWTNQMIAKRVGRTATNVAEAIMLAESNTDVKDMVAEGTVAAHTAVKMVRQHGSKAGTKLKEELETARLKGKKKVTAGAIGGATPKNLPEAIKAEMESGGTFRAENLCPKYADLITYLRGTAK